MSAPRFASRRSPGDPAEGHPVGWAPTAGEAVVVAKPDRHEGTASLTETTITKVGKRDVVCSDGSRWSLRRLAGDHITEAYRSGDRSYQPRAALYPTTAARVGRWRRRNAGIERRRRLQIAVSALDDAVRTGQPTQGHVDAVNAAWAALTAYTREQEEA